MTQHLSSRPICSLTATEMAVKIREGDITSIELVESHIARIEAINPTLNALIAPMFDAARRDALAADLALESGKVLGPLHGVPVTIKEFFDVRGTATTAGIESNNELRTTDSPLVARLREAGAVVLGKTNVAQMGIAIESSNPVYGRTSNPWDTTRSSGGSSGGEGALIAAGGSPLGLGSDGGGSIRIPSHFNGICGLKPTSGRLTMRGHWQFPAFPRGWAVPGPMARCVDDLELAMQCLVARDGEPSDPTVAPGAIQPSGEINLSTLTVGYFVDDGLFPPSPAIRRAVGQAIETMKSAGANVVPFQPADSLETWDIQFRQFGADGGVWLRRFLEGSRSDTSIKKALLLSRIPTVLRRLLPVMLNLTGQTSLAAVLHRVPKSRLSVFDFQSVLEQQQAFRQTYLRRLDEQQIDALICPPFASVAMQHDSPDIVLAIAYTHTFNLLGMPAGVIPATTVQPDEESDRAPSRDDVVRDLLRAEAGSAGMPVGVQVVARHWREDVALAIMRHLQNAMSASTTFPQTPRLPS